MNASQEYRSEERKQSGMPQRASAQPSHLPKPLLVASLELSLLICHLAELSLGLRLLISKPSVQTFLGHPGLLL